VTGGDAVGQSEKNRNKTGPNRTARELSEGLKGLDIPFYRLNPAGFPYARGWEMKKGCRFN